jgi:hypothetical protein
MIWLDYIILVSLVLLAGAAVFRNYFWLRVLALVVLFLTGVFFEMSLDPIARGVISRRHREGNWTQQYSEGVDDMERATRTYRPYRLIAIAGLALFAFRNTRKDVPASKAPS